MTVMLYIGNLPLDSTADDLAALLEPVARIESIAFRAAAPAADYRQATVGIADRDLARALAALQSAHLRGKRLAVRPALAEER